MKYLKLFFITALSIFTICSCTDSNIVPEEPETPVTPDEPEEPETPEETGPDYLFMFYGVGGGSLDDCLISNIFQALDAGSDEKVKMTFQYKLSAKKQEEHPKFDGTRRLTGDGNEHLKGQFKKIMSVYPLVSPAKYDSLFAELKTEKIGSADYDMSRSDSLTAFIKWSKDKYPTAKRTVLVLAGHGRGWALTHDSKDNAQTRSTLMDDNFKDKTYLTLNTVVNGVKNAGKVDVLYADACLMSMYEVLYGYAECTRYYMASMEKTPAAGGNYINFINLLKQAGTTDEGLEDALRKHCDNCVSEHWPKDKFSFADLGFYDLSKLGKLTEVLKDVTDTLVKKYTSEESIEPTKEGTLPLGNRFGKYIDNAFMKCEIVDTNLKVEMGQLTEWMLKLAREANVELEDGHKILYWLGSVYVGRDMKIYDDITLALEALSTESENSFSLTDLLRHLDNSLVEVGANNNPFGALRTKLLSVLKEISYIKCTNSKAHAGIDEEYELCSPGILIVPLSQELYENYAANATNFNWVNLENALKSYQGTTFDQQIGWSRILTLLDVYPSFATNPIRRYVE